MASTSKVREPLSLLTIPREIREHIFSYLFHPISTFTPISADTSRELKTYDLSLLRTCTQIHSEAFYIFRKQNTFVRISTPFAEAEHWVSVHGNVPMVRMRSGAKDFTLHLMDAKIDSPRFQELQTNLANSFVVLLEDLEAFAEHWFYTDVTNPGQNRHLRLTLEIRNPYVQAYEDDALPARLQRALIMPFGCTKGLNDFVIHGTHLMSIEKEVRDRQAVPNKSVRELLEETARLKDEGNEAFKEKNWEEALRLYLEAFKALYIFCEGRKRKIWGDGTFQVYVSGGPYDNQFAQQVRLMFRITLVANVVAVYLKMNMFEDAKFWGLRTIDLMNESTGQPDEVMLGFPGSESIGKIYFRTGMACIELGDKSEARRLLRVAAAYRPTDLIVRDALASVALPLC